MSINNTNKLNFNSSNLVDRWFGDFNDTSIKEQLFKDTEQVTTILRTKTKKAEELANIILKSLDPHIVDEAELVIDRIRSNTLKSGKHLQGAYPCWHNLFEAAKEIIETSSTDRTFAVINYIDAAAIDLMERADTSIHRLYNKDAYVVPDILNLIVANSVEGKSVKDAWALRQTSKDVRQKAANNFRGPLKDLKIVTADQAIAYAKEFGKQLPYLDISGIDFSDSTKMEELIKHLPNLTTFIATNAKLNDKGAEHLSKLLKLTRLDLSFNQIGPAGAEHISKLLNLTVLHLGGNKIGDVGAEHIGKLLNLIELYLGANQIGPVGAEHISKLIKLTVLYLAGNKIGDAGTEHIGKLINLTELNLARNQIGPAGAGHISKLLNLLILNLDHNQIGDAGTEEIGKLLNLIELDLTCNQIGPVGTGHISMLPNLTKLYLGTNQIGDAGAEYVGKLLTLTLLYLGANQINDTGAMHINKLINLIELDLDSNQIGDEAIGSLKNNCPLLENFYYM